MKNNNNQFSQDNSPPRENLVRNSDSSRRDFGQSNFGDRAPRSNFGAPRDNFERAPRRDFEGSRPAEGGRSGGGFGGRSGGGRPSFGRSGGGFGGNRSGGGRPSFGGRSGGGFGGNRFGGGRPSFGGRSGGSGGGFGGNRSFGDRPRPSFGGDRASEGNFENRAPAEFSQGAESENRSSGERSDFARQSDRPSFGRSGGGFGGNRSGGGRPSFGGRSGGGFGGNRFGGGRPSFGGRSGGSGGGFGGNRSGGFRERSPNFERNEGNFSSRENNSVENAELNETEIPQEGFENRNNENRNNDNRRSFNDRPRDNRSRSRDDRGFRGSDSRRISDESAEMEDERNYERKLFQEQNREKEFGSENSLKKGFEIDENSSKEQKNFLEEKRKLSNEVALKIKYEFKNRDLERCFIHPSAQKNSLFQRLEFLGDRILARVISGIIFDEFPHYDEEELSLDLSNLVRRETLAKTAENLDFMRQNIEYTGQMNSSILADVFEAWIGAIDVDGGDVKEVISKAYELIRFLAQTDKKNPKNLLQEFAQKHQMDLLYSYENVEDFFKTTLTLNGEKKFSCTAVGKSKKEASERAAKKLLAIVTKE